LDLTAEFVGIYTPLPYSLLFAARRNKVQREEADERPLPQIGGKTLSVGVKLFHLKRVSFFFLLTILSYQGIERGEKQLNRIDECHYQDHKLVSNL
jgi:hypothetical protein